MNGSSVGKSVGRRLYLHTSSLPSASEAVQSAIQTASSIAGRTLGQDFNVVRVDEDCQQCALLSYPGFFEEAFPRLHRSWKVDLKASNVSYRTYEGSINPPILHRKELLLPLEDQRRAEFAALTRATESLGLFNDPSRIGFQLPWEELISHAGYRVDGHVLVPLGNEEGEELGLLETVASNGAVARHLTALTRYGLSAPMQALMRYGLLTTSTTVFDYGCGKGDDLCALREQGIAADGWDPHFAPDEMRREADVVNLGFVINVIEDFGERVDALKQAFALARNVLAVSTMLVSSGSVSGKAFRDGILTSRNTFQKYYTQSELAAFIAEVLDEEPVPVSPGVFFVFRDKDLEQRFLSGRQRSSLALTRVQVLSRQREKIQRIPRSDALYESHRKPLEALWDTWLRLGREPHEDEVEGLRELLAGFRSFGRAMRFIAGRKDGQMLDAAQALRISDLTTYFALAQFSKRKPYTQLEPTLQRDIKYFFGDYTSAVAAAKKELFSLADPSALEAACKAAAEEGLGWLDEGHSLQLHTSLVERLPTLLRVYVGCATILYGDVTTADLVKIHIRSGKLSLMEFDDFEAKPLPRMMRRVKLNFRSQAMDAFEYGGEFPAPYLFLKSRFVNEEFPNYSVQIGFEEHLEALKLFDLSGYGPAPAEFERGLAGARWEVDGFKLVRSRSLPGLDEQCGQHFTYRQLIECGETQARTQLPNVPKHADSFNALFDLATKILDPVIEYFGAIELTYGFCSPELARAIWARIAPKLDQHAASERTKSGNAICPRLGAAVDFLVRDESMLEVANWIAINLPFDRLYYYGENRPIHVSFGPEMKGEFVEIISTATGRRVPRVRPRTVIQSSAPRESEKES